MCEEWLLQRLKSYFAHNKTAELILIILSVSLQREYYLNRTIVRSVAMRVSVFTQFRGIREREQLCHLAWKMVIRRSLIWNLAGEWESRGKKKVSCRLRVFEQGCKSCDEQPLGHFSVCDIKVHSWRGRSFVAELLIVNTLELDEGVQYGQLISWCFPCHRLLLLKGKFEEH